MRQNVFMTSMYFFIPLKKLGCAASKEYLSRKWTKMAVPPYLKNSDDLLHKMGGQNRQNAHFSNWI